MGLGALEARAQVCPITDPQCWQEPDPEPLRPPPIVSVAPHSGSFVDASRGATTAGYTTPAYTSADRERSLTVMYTSGTASPTSLVQVDATDTSGDPPSSMSIRLWNVQTGTWQTFTNGSQEIFYQTSGYTTGRLSAQFETGTLPTAAYDYDVVVTSYWPDGSQAAAAPARVRVLVLNERDSPYGIGWTVAGLQRLYPRSSGVLLVEGDGTGRFFTYPGSCVQGQNTAWCGFTSPEGDFTRLARNTQTGEWVRLYPDGTVVMFGADYRIKSVTDAGTTTFAYDGAGRLSTVTDPAGLAITLGYDVAGKLAWIRDPTNRTVTTRVTAGVLDQICDPVSCAFAAGYDTRQRLSWQTERGGARWDYGYDAHGQVATVQAPTVTVSGPSTVRPTSTFRSLQMAVLPAAGTGSQWSPAARVDSAAIRVSTTDPLGNTVYARTDRLGNATRIEEPGSRVTTILRDTHGRPTRVTAFNGDATEYTYTGAEPATVRDVTANRTTTYTWTQAYLSPHPAFPIALQRVFPVKLSTPGEPTREYVKPVTEVLPLNLGSTRYYYDEFDALGRPAAVYGPGSHTLYFFGATGARNTDSLYVVTGTDTLRSRFTRDAAGRVTAATSDASGLTSMTYDALNRPATVTDASGTTQYGYAPQGWLSTVTDPKSQQYTYSRNALGWIESETDPRGGVMRMAYDALGRVVSGTNRRAQTVRYEYDSLGRMWRQTTHEGAVTTYTYDPNGRWAAVQNAESTDTIRTFPGGATPSVDQVTVRGGTRYALNTRRDSVANFARVTTNWGYGVTQYYLDRQTQRVRELRDDRLGLATTIARDTVLNTLRHVLPTGDTIVYAPKQSRYTDPTGGVLGRFYAYDGLERATQRGTTATSGDAFEYNALGALEAERKFDWSVSYAYLSARWYPYDAAGNPTHSGATVTNGNRLEAFDGFTLTYDADGNITRKVKPGVLDQTLTWNSLGQLTRVTSTAGLDVTYGYDGSGRRVRKTVNGVVTRYLYDGQHVVAETNGAGAVTREYTYYQGVDQPHSMRVMGGQTYYYVTDAQGNVQALANASGAVVNRYEYTLFGAPVTTTEQVANPLRYAGREYDAETGLYFNRMRYYDPALQRFVSEDPLGLSGGRNPYSYADNDPVNGSDPTGLEPCASWQINIMGICIQIGYLPIPGVSNLDPYILPHPRAGWDRALHERTSYDPTDEVIYREQMDQMLQAEQASAARTQGIQSAITSVREGTDIGVGFIPVVATIHDASVLFTGRNVVTGERVGLGGRGVALIGMVTPISGGEMRGAWKTWQLTAENSGKVLRHVSRKWKFTQHLSDGSFWSKDIAGHGESVWKVFKKEGDGLHWRADADEFGTFMGDKHKGPTGMFIPNKDLFGL